MLRALAALRALAGKVAFEDALQYDSLVHNSYEPFLDYAFINELMHDTTVPKRHNPWHYEVDSLFVHIGIIYLSDVN